MAMLGFQKRSNLGMEAHACYPAPGKLKKDHRAGLDYTMRSCHQKVVTKSSNLLVKKQNKGLRDGSVVKTKRLAAVLKILSNPELIWRYGSRAHVYNSSIREAEAGGS